jgi:hypothetical protein
VFVDGHAAFDADPHPLFGLVPATAQELFQYGHWAEPQLRPKAKG